MGSYDSPWELLVAQAATKMLFLFRRSGTQMLLDGTALGIVHSYCLFLDLSFLSEATEISPQLMIAHGVYLLSKLRRVLYHIFYHFPLITLAGFVILNLVLNI